MLINDSLMFLLPSDLDTDGHLIFRLREKTHGVREHSRAISKSVVFLILYSTFCNCREFSFSLLPARPLAFLI